ncbi:MAG: hypothetical protein AAF085_05250, partial [Planctomycetota bacterium]
MNSNIIICLSPLLGLLTACQPTTELVYLPGPNYPRPYGGFDPEVLWSPAKGDTAGRMELIGELDPDPWSFPNRRTIYRTTWQTDRFETDEVLVVIQSPAGALGSFTQWQVFVYDRDFEMLDYGQV